MNQEAKIEHLKNKLEKYAKALIIILIFAQDDNDGDNIEAIKNIASQILKE